MQAEGQLAFGLDRGVGRLCRDGEQGHQPSQEQGGRGEHGEGFAVLKDDGAGRGDHGAGWIEGDHGKLALKAWRFGGG